MRRYDPVRRGRDQKLSAGLAVQTIYDGNCAPGHYYHVDNEYPSYDHLGNPNQKSYEFPAGPGFALGPQTIPTIGDALSAQQISWRYYREGFALAADPPIANQLYARSAMPFSIRVRS